MAEKQSKKTKLSKKQVKHIAQLANLQLSEAEVKKFQQELSDTLAYMEILNEVDTKQVQPAAQVTGLENIFSQDKTGKCLSQSAALSGAQEKDQGYFKTKKVI